MLSKLRTLLTIASIMRQGKYVGDAAALKLTLGRENEGKSPYREQILQYEALNFSQIQIEDLRKMEPASLGRAYYDFMERNHLKPLNFSERVRELHSRYPISMRYIRLHDMFHTLLGFEADIKGEAGVYAFIAVQDYTEILTKAAKTARWVSKLVLWQREEVQRAQKLGARLGKNAKVLIIQPLETFLPLPLKQVRRDVGLLID